MSVTFNFDVLTSGRTVIGDTLDEIGKKDERLYVVTSDIGGALKNFRADCPNRYIDVGIAEQCAAGLAAGLALDGNIPVIMGMIPFMTMRACEQIRTAICYQNLPVRLIGTGGGLTSGGGSTHNAMEDIALMRSFVNMSVISIGDPNMIRDILYLGMDYPGPMFIRLAQGKEDHVIYEPGTIKYEIGKGIVAKDGDDATIFAHGEMVYQALEAASKLEKEGIHVRVADMYSIKPVDEQLIVKCVEETGHIVVLEDHLMTGGLASVISEVLLEKGIQPKGFKKLGIPQVYAGFGSGEELRAKYGYDEAATVQAVKSLLQ
ncbi:MAG: transketolase family protein [Lachnospiraceae bacterium]|jgi:transketolase|nr:transketolase family protein [Lachnospiraceae bacterium]